MVSYRVSDILSYFIYGISWHWNWAVSSTGFQCSIDALWLSNERTGKPPCLKTGNQHLLIIYRWVMASIAMFNKQRVAWETNGVNFLPPSCSIWTKTRPSTHNLIGHSSKSSMGTKPVGINYHCVLNAPRLFCSSDVRTCLEFHSVCSSLKMGCV